MNSTSAASAPVRPLAKQEERLLAEVGKLGEAKQI